MSGVNKVEVVISGKVFTLVANEGAEYIQKLARYIDKKTGELKGSNSSANINPDLRSLLIAINIADDHFKEKEKNETLELSNKTLTREIEQEKNINGELSAEIIKLTMENREQRDKISRLENLLGEAKKELGDYIDAFDSTMPNLKAISSALDAKKPFNKR